MIESNGPTVDNLSNSENHHQLPDQIKPINSNTVHRICSGQVVLSLAIAVKELVENAIDVKATNIEVRLKGYGLELIEVSDNGSGVRQENFEALALKHYTSKLQQFTDLESIDTLGFRGEALSALCALSDLTIITRHSSAEYGTKVCYDSGGKIKSSTPAARVIGTTVTLENLFKSLPVRRQEFTKNLKKEYSKMCQLLYAYCLVLKGVKFTCTNQANGGSRSVVISTEGSNAVRENIISLFGTKQVQSLVEINMLEPDDQLLADYKLQVSGEPLPFNFECIVSNAVHGSGRSTTDRQFFYINDRPCEPHKIIRLINEVYRQFNPHQYPFVFLNVIMEKSFVDVNVTPDKRQIFMNKEKLLLATLKTSLLGVFKSCPSTCVSNMSVDVSKFIEKGSKRSLDSPDCKLQRNGTKEKLLDLFGKRNQTKKESLIQPTLTESSSFKITIEEEGLEHVSKKPKILEEGNLENVSKKPKIQVEQPILTIEEENLEKVSKKPKIQVEQPILAIEEGKLEVVSKKSKIQVEQPTPAIEEGTLEHVFKKPTMPVIKIQSPQPKKKVDLIEASQKAKVDLVTSSKHRTVTARTSMDYIKELLESRDQETQSSTQVRFRAEIMPSANKSAEEELQKQLEKNMFKKMHVIGQFNLGFIITKLESDLFIVDQHATDEKYNFEQLQLNTVMQNQILVNPSALELSAANEELLIANEEIFQKSGFKFIIDPNAPATKKVKLSTIPISKNCIFGKDDIEEMLFMMQEEVNLSACRPTRMRSMFASRACRKSVMVGCPLNQTDMRRLVDHMGEIDQPWNCPHGRPTIRHLINLNLLEDT